MKAFVLIVAVVIAAITCIAATPVSSSSSSSSTKIGSSSSKQDVDADAQAAAQAQHQSQSMADLSRTRKSAYGGGGSSLQAPPCPKNYLFSCQPSMAAAPCAPPPAAGGYGSAASYSAPVPSYITPVQGSPVMPQNYAAGSYLSPQGFNYANANQFYPY